MPIIGTLPSTISNGQAVDATPVMADFNFIVNQVNANGVQVGTLAAPTGTSMAFQQAAAPTGWVAQTGTAFSDAFLRCIIPSAFAGSGGAGSASGFFLGPFTSDGHALTVAELAVHNHTDSGHVHGITDPGHSHRPSNLNNFTTDAGGGNSSSGPGALPNTSVAGTNTVTTGISINSSTANIQNTGSGSAHSHTITGNCKYIDQIIAVKS